MHVENDYKIVLFVSTGRCGTTRLAELLGAVLVPHKVGVKHQVSLSRLSNILGHILFYTGGGEWLKEWLFRKIIQAHGGEKGFVSTDPLTSMIIPRSILERKETYVIHIIRDPKEFAKSFYSFSRKRAFSFIAHNFIPFWQPGLWPLENILKGKRTKESYARIAVVKNKFFSTRYSVRDRYSAVPFEDVFRAGFLQQKMLEIFEIKVAIDQKILNIKANES